MKRTRTIVAIIAVAIFAGVSIFAACTKEDNKETISSKNKDLCTELNMSPGELHNLLLKNNLFHENYGTASEYAYLQQDYAYLQTLGLPTYITFDEYVSSVDTNGIDDDVSLYDIVLEGADVYNYSSTFINLASKFNRAESIISIDSFINYFQLMQDTIAMFADLTDDERYILDGAISIGIKSAMFWEYDYPQLTDSIVAKARRSQCTNCNIFIPKDPNFTCRENARVRWADLKGWFRSFNSSSSKSVSRRKHTEILFEHGEGYTEGD